jgi:hypothetical protein
MALAAQAGGSAGAVPLAPKYRGMLHAGATIVREEGIAQLRVVGLVAYVHASTARLQVR